MNTTYSVNIKSTWEMRKIFSLTEEQSFTKYAGIFQLVFED